MGLFDMFKKKEEPQQAKPNSVLLAMPMFNSGETFDLKKVVDYLQTNWNTSVTDISGDNNTVAFKIHGEMVVLSTIAVQVPWGDIQETAKYAYNWPSAEKDLENHNSHVLVTVFSGNKSQVERFSILTMVLSSILATSNAIGIYQGSQSLLIPREQYLESAEALKSNSIPVDLWVYIGFRVGENSNNAYTYGLKAFDKTEMEFINAKIAFEDILGFLMNICAYVIKNNIHFKSGETLGYTAEQKIKLTKSKGLFVEGETLKLEM